MKRLTTRSFLLSIAISLLSACGGSDDDNPGGNQNDPPAASPSPSPDVSPEPSVEPSPEPSVEPSPEPSPEVSPEPEPEPSPSPIPDSTSAPIEITTTLVSETFTVSGDVTILQSDGNTLVSADYEGHTLYVRVDDQPDGDASNCSGGCIDAWPPLLASESAEEQRPLTIIERADGHRQWALRGKPLYLFNNDTAAGDINGHGAGDIWFAATSAPISYGKLDIDDTSVDAFVGGYGKVFIHNGIDSAWVNKEGFALYTFVNDQVGEPSVCTEICLANWPALIADENDIAVEPFSLIEHPEVGLQWAYHGKPLYLRAQDIIPGAAVENPAWPVAQPVPFQGEPGLILGGVGETFQATFEEGNEVISLVPSNGMSLYTFNSDTAGQASTCVSEACMNAWPALMAGNGAIATGSFSLITRDSGGEQWALDGLPLYFRAADTAPGENNENANWPIARLPITSLSDAGYLVANSYDNNLNGQSLYFRAADSETGTVSLQDVVDNVFEPHCGTCHDASAMGGLVIAEVDNSEIHANLLSAAIASGATGASADLNLVEPYEPDLSYLVHTLQDEPGIGGSRMPAFNNTPLDEDLIAMVREWITNGAPLEGTGAPAPCGSACLSVYPPYLAEDGAAAFGDYSIFTNTNGDSQWAYNGRPLYFFVGDEEAGEQNASNSWPLATPDDAEPQPEPSPTPAIDAPLTRSVTLLNDVIVASGEVTVLNADGSTSVRDDLDGFTLYTLASDVPDTGVSSCIETCLETWLPLLASENDVNERPFTVVIREDGHSQWALRDKPLYFFANDNAAGDINGHRAGDTWHAASNSPTALEAITVNNQSVDAIVGGAGRVFIHDGIDSAWRNKEGYALYTFANDSAGEPSTCDTTCLGNWPALIADENDVAIAPFSLIAHPDASVGLQWAYRGMPLYFRTADDAPGTALASEAWPVAKAIPFLGSAGTVLAGVSEVLVATITDSEEVMTLAAKNGMSLYTFANDTAGEASTCVSETCLNAWPALMAGNGAEAFGPFTLIERDAGGQQWALDGWPLYFRAADTSPGENNETETWPAARISPANFENGNLLTHGTVVDGGEFAGRTLYFRAADSQTGSVTFQDVQENVFNPNCGGCHGSFGGLTLTGIDAADIHTNLLAAAVAAGASGDSVGLNRVEPNDPDNSYLIHTLQEEPGIGGTVMPPSGALSDDLINMVREWISFGAPLEGTGSASPCDSNCLAAWPPYLAAPGAVASGLYSIITNANGDSQWAYNGNPLYFFSGDAAPGDNNVSDAWPQATGSEDDVAPEPAPTPEPTPEPQAAPIALADSLLGDIYVASGDVTILLSSGETETRNDLDGLTLYTFASDVPGTEFSACSDACLDSWLPILAGEADEDELPLNVVLRADGEYQWALRGKPLYAFAGDTAAGELNGHLTGGNWFAATSAPLVPGQLAQDDLTLDALVAQGEVLIHDGDQEARVIKEGFALYTFANDQFDEGSTCDSSCLVNWPALMADTGDVAQEPFSLIEHPDDSIGLQWAYRGMPLYFRAADENPGEAVNNAAWPVVLPIPFQGSVGTVLAASGEVFTATITDSEEVIAPSALHGMTLYTYTNDGADLPSTCVSEACLNAWPALMAGSGATAFGPFTLIARSAGGLQWALDGKPLYFRAADTTPGENNESALWPAARISPAGVSGGNLVANGPEIDGGLGFTSQALYFRAADTETGTVSLQDVRDSVFTPHCSGCHGTSGGLTLTNASNEEIHAQLLSVAIAEGTSGASVGLNRVEPYDPDNSYLVHTLQDEPGLGGSFGRMPALTAELLPDNLIDMVREWITNGAPLEGTGSPEPACTDACLVAWPPFLAEEGAVATAPYSIVTNANGDEQWAYNGSPLYFFSGDSAPEDNNASVSWPLATQ